ncbi:hypothetical protein TYRP_003240 [Tyrophagus putrescentiae]|nr:hypothetical protein TYRP_003240 [Tyrophagus putrescentiae]
MAHKNKKKKDSKKGGHGKSNGGGGGGGSNSSKSNPKSSSSFGSSGSSSGYSGSSLSSVASSSSSSSSSSSLAVKPFSIPALSSSADEYMKALVRDYLVRQSLPLSLLVHRCFRLRALHPAPDRWWEDLDPALPTELQDGFLLCSLAGLTRAYLEPLAAQTIAAIRAELEHRQLFVVLSSFTNLAYEGAPYAALMAGILEGEDGDEKEDGHNSLPRVYLLKTVPIGGLKSATEVTDAAVNMFFNAMKLVWPEDKSRWLRQVRLVVHSAPFAPTAKVLATINPTRLLTVPSLEGAISRLEATLRLLLQPRLQVTRCLLSQGGYPPGLGSFSSSSSGDQPNRKDNTSWCALIAASRDYFARFAGLAVIHGVQMFISLFTAESFLAISGIPGPLPRDGPDPEDATPPSGGGRGQMGAEQREVLNLVGWMAFVEEHYEALVRFFSRQEYRFSDGSGDHGFSSRDHWADFGRRFGRPLAEIRRALAEGGQVRRRAVDVLALVERLQADLAGRETSWERALGHQLGDWLEGAAGLQKMMAILKGGKGGGGKADPKTQELKSLLKYAPLGALTVEQCFPGFAGRILRPAPGPGNREIKQPEVMEAHAVIICAQESWRRKFVAPKTGEPASKEPEEEEIHHQATTTSAGKKKKKKNRKKKKVQQEQDQKEQSSPATAATTYRFDGPTTSEEEEDAPR